MKTTLNAIKKHSPCVEGYSKLLKFLGKRRADDEVLDLSVILESNGIIDTIWCFRAVEGYEKEKRLFAVFCVRQIQHIIMNQRSIDAIDVSERYAHGQATDAELTAARDAANAAAYSAYSAASDADSAFAAFASVNAAFAASYAAAKVYPYPKVISIVESYLKNLLTEEK